jgi:hypothetical protein
VVSNVIGSAVGRIAAPELAMPQPLAYACEACVTSAIKVKSVGNQSVSILSFDRWKPWCECAESAAAVQPHETRSRIVVVDPR